MDPFVSVIVATRNRAGLLAETLEGLARQQWPRGALEIIVADNASTDGTRLAVETAAARAGAPPIRYLFVPECGKSHAVNAALAIADGDVLAFTDDDVVPEPNWISRLVAALDETGAEFAAGRILPRWEATPPSWVSPALYGVLAIPDNGETRLLIATGDHFDIIPVGANMALRRLVVERVGGLRADLGKLDGTLRTGEDHEFFLRMLASGFRGVYEPTATVRHWVPRERLHRAYFRRWLHQNGRDVARLEVGYTTGVRRWLGVPRYLWRRLAVDAVDTLLAALTGDARRRIASGMRVVWFAGYVREAWFGADRAQAMRLAGNR